MENKYDVLKDKWVVDQGCVWGATPLPVISTFTKKPVKVRNRDGVLEVRKCRQLVIPNMGDLAEHIVSLHNASLS